MSSQINCLDYVPAQRALHLIDFENLIGGPNTDLASAARSVDRYSDLSEYEKPDHLIIGVNPALAVDAGQFWPGAQLVTHKGADGADIALMDAIHDVEWLASRYYRLIIGSGDHIFQSAVIDYTSAGIEVGVVSRRSSISNQLRASADWVLEY
jgi:hypothetical protein